MAEIGTLSLHDAVELFYMAMETQDRFFEFWISATFAVIIACHLGSRTLTPGFSAILALMYTAFFGKHDQSVASGSRSRDQVPF